MAETTLTVKQLIDLNLWDKVREFKGWDEWIFNEGRIGEDDLVTFDSEFKKNTKEEEIVSLYKRYDYPMVYESGVKFGIEKTLEILGIEIEGIN